MIYIHESKLYVMFLITILITISKQIIISSISLFFFNQLLDTSDDAICIPGDPTWGSNLKVEKHWIHTNDRSN